MTRGTYVLAALALALATGCSEPRAGSLPPPATPPAKVSTQKPSATPSPKPPPYRAEVEQAVRRYYAALQAAVQDPARQRGALRDLIDPGCACWRLVSVLDREAAHGRYVDYTLTIENLAVPEATPSRGTAHVTIAQSSGHLYDSGGRVVEAIGRRTDSYFVDMRRTRRGWLVARVTER